MRGYLRKKVKENKLFQRTKFPKRFFAIDFQLGNLKIYQNEIEWKSGTCTDYKEIICRDILKCSSLGSGHDDDTSSKNNEKASKNYTVPFQLCTAERNFELYSCSEEERNMWLAGFEYMIVSTQEVQ